jgi:hypothetical protein
MEASAGTVVVADGFEETANMSLESSSFESPRAALSSVEPLLRNS